MAQLTKDRITLENIKEKLAQMFAPDVSFLWDDKFRSYRLTPITDAGKAWMRLTYGYGRNEAPVAASLLDGMVKLAGNSGLCVQVIDQDDTKTYDTIKGKFMHSYPKQANNEQKAKHNT